jgi:hypothetical protein
MTGTVSERASAAVQPPPGIGHNKPRAQKVCCPACEFAWDLIKGGKPRSIEQHKRFFQIVKATFHHWPESHERQFGDLDDCRTWLITKAGYCKLHSCTDLKGKSRDDAIMICASALLAAARTPGKPFSDIRKGKFYVWKTDSISFQNMPHLLFCKLNDAVSDVIKAEMGITADELLEQHKGAA